MRSTKSVLIGASRELGAAAALRPSPSRHPDHPAVMFRTMPGVGPTGQRAVAASVLAKAARFFKAVWTKASNRIPAAPIAAMPLTS